MESPISEKSLLAFVMIVLAIPLSMSGIIIVALPLGLLGGYLLIKEMISQYKK